MQMKTITKELKETISYATLNTGSFWGSGWKKRKWKKKTEHRVEPNWQEKSNLLNDKEDKLLSNDKGQITTAKAFYGYNLTFYQFVRYQSFLFHFPPTRRHSLYFETKRFILIDKEYWDVPCKHPIRVDLPNLQCEHHWGSWMLM